MFVVEFDIGNFGGAAPLYRFEFQKVSTQYFPNGTVQDFQVLDATEMEVAFVNLTEVSGTHVKQRFAQELFKEPGYQFHKADYLIPIAQKADFLQPQAQYRVRVRGENSIGPSPWSGHSSLDQGMGYVMAPPDPLTNFQRRPHGAPY